MTDKENISDGYHTFKELYQHRNMLFIALCNIITSEFETPNRNHVWRSKKHSDLTTDEEYFILGLFKKKGQQVTYHLPIDMWSLTDFAETLEKAPEFDGHNSEDVLKRLRNTIL